MKNSFNGVVASIAVLAFFCVHFAAADAVGTSVSIANSPPEISFASAAGQGGRLEAVFSISDNNGAGDIRERSAQCSAYDSDGNLLGSAMMRRAECGGISCSYSCSLQLAQTQGTITVKAVASDSGGAEARAEAKIGLANAEGAGRQAFSESNAAAQPDSPGSNAGGPPASSGEPAPVTGLAVTGGNGIYGFLSGFFSWLGSLFK